VVVVDLIVSLVTDVMHCRLLSYLTVELSLIQATAPCRRSVMLLGWIVLFPPQFLPIPSFRFVSFIVSLLSNCLSCFCFCFVAWLSVAFLSLIPSLSSLPSSKFSCARPGWVVCCFKRDCAVCGVGELRKELRYSRLWCLWYGNTTGGAQPKLQLYSGHR
jgi:hypothetical protein